MKIVIKIFYSHINKKEINFEKIKNKKSKDSSSLFLDKKIEGLTSIFICHNGCGANTKAMLKIHTKNCNLDAVIQIVETKKNKISILYISGNLKNFDGEIIEELVCINCGKPCQSDKIPDFILETHDITKKIDKKNLN